MASLTTPNGSTTPPPASLLAMHGGDPVRSSTLPYGKQTINADDIKAVVECLQEPYLTTGPRVKAFEDAVCEYTGAAHAVAVANGTCALHAAVFAAGIGPGDEVIVSDITFVASSNAVLYEGGTVVFADVDRETMNVDVAKVEALVTPKTKAIIAVDMCGQPVDLDPLLAIARRHGLVLIEDASHAIGASYKGRKVGNIADITTLSFHPVKNITTGEGGMVCTNDAGFFARASMFRTHGIDRSYKDREAQASHRYDMVALGYNLRITDIQCALGIQQMTRLDQFIARRNEICARYTAAFAGFDTLVPVRDIPGVTVNAHHLYVVRLRLENLTCDRDTFFTALRKERIGVNVHYLPVHAHAYYQNNFDGAYSPIEAHCPEANALYKEIVSLPCFPLMTDGDVDDAIAAVAKVQNAFTATGRRQPVPARGGVTLRRCTNFEKSDAYRAEIHQLIPGGAHTYSKGDDQWPLLSPAAIERGDGAYVFDLDGNKFLDCSLGLTSVSLGHGFKPVINAVVKQLHLGANYQRPASLERVLAKEFLAQVPGHDRIKMAKNGSTVTTAAMKLARGFTGRKYVCRPKNHPFYSYDDWFIATTPCDFGIPDEVKALTLTFDSMNPDSLRELVRQYPDQIAGLITEPDSIADCCAYDREAVARAHREIGDICREHGIVYIVDEMVSGYRAGFPGAYTVYGHEADMCCWGKSIGNGMSFCALTGRAEIMDIGGIKQHRDRDGKEYPRLFLCSTTHGAEAHGLAAALEVIKTYRENDVIGHVHGLVEACSAGVRALVQTAGLEEQIVIKSNTWVNVSIFKGNDGKANSPLRTLFIQEMIKRGVLFQGIFLACYQTSMEDVAYFLKAYEESLVVYKQALDQGNTDGLLVGDACKPVFRKWN